jgi:hypothetical protein
MTIRTTPAACALLAALALVGCSSTGSSDSAPPKAPEASASSSRPAAEKAGGDEKAALTAAVRAYSAAYFKPDADAARALLSDRCKATAPEADYKAALTEAVATYGHQAVKSVAVDRLSGNVGVVSYSYSVPALDQKGQAWVKESGGWHYDAC